MIKAIGDRIVLIPEPIQDNIGGIYIPDTSLKKPMRGKVVSVGEDCKEVKVGYEIIFLEGHGVTIEDKLIITEKDVLGYTFEKNNIKEYFLPKLYKFYNEELYGPTGLGCPHPGEKFIREKINDDLRVIEWAIDKL